MKSRVDSDVLAILSRYGEPGVLDANKVVLRNPTADTSSLLSELVSKGVKVEEVKKVGKSVFDKRIYVVHGSPRNTLYGYLKPDIP